MDTEVRVVLTALNDFISPAVRTITLTRDNPSFSIGRASKSLSKGLQSAADNAWFDSPVMSRDHATIFMDPEDATLFIQDIGSMHGTYMDSTILVTKEPTPINDGVIVQFGTEVKRGSEIFSACSFRVTFDKHRQRSRNTFAFPDTSDFEEEYELSDEDIETREHADPTSKGPALKKASQAIDLTGDDSPFRSQAIDLTEDTFSEGCFSSVPKADLTGDNDNAGPTTKGQYVAPGLYVASSPINIESEDEEDRSSNDPDSRSNSDALDFDDITASVLSPSICEDFAESEDEDMEEGEEEGEQAENICAKEVEHASPRVQSNNVSHFPESASHNSDVLLYDEDARLVSTDDESDEQSDVDLSDAGNEGLRALFEDDVQQYGMNPSEVDMALEYAQAKIQEHLNQPLQPLRQPSPSDAAMVKNTSPSQQNHSQTGICLPGEVGNASAQILGDKTGKIAYFKAREVNKAKFQSLEEPDTSAGDRFLGRYLDGTRLTNQIGSRNDRTLGDSSSSNDHYISGFVPTHKSLDPPPSSPPQTAGLQKSFTGNMDRHCLKTPAMPTRDLCDFLDNPDQNILPVRDISPLPDMTSAVVYNNSKESMAAAASAAAMASAHSRSAIKIKDIIESHHCAQRTPSLKRKADDISDASQEELRSWAKVSSTPTVSNTVSAVNVSPPPREVLVGMAANAGTPPSKKRKLLENMAYLALGAVGTAATLFSVLVATAPDFA